MYHLLPQLTAKFPNHIVGVPSPGSLLRLLNYYLPRGHGPEVPDHEIDVCSDDLNELHDMWSDSDGSDVLGADECGGDAPSPLELSGFAA